MTSISTKYWHFMLSQGLLVSSHSYYPLLLIILQSSVLLINSLDRPVDGHGHVPSHVCGIAVLPHAPGRRHGPHHRRLVSRRRRLPRRPLSAAQRERHRLRMVRPRLRLHHASGSHLRFRRHQGPGYRPERPTSSSAGRFKDPVYDIIVVSSFFLLVGMFIPLFYLPSYGVYSAAWTRDSRPTFPPSSTAPRFWAASSRGSSATGSGE